MKKIALFLIGMFLFLSFFSCFLVTPDFLVGRWVRSNEYGEVDRFVFLEDGTFAVVYYESKLEIKRIIGTYKIGFSIIEFSFNQEKQISAYQMYGSNINFTWNGQRFRLRRLEYTDWIEARDKFFWL